ncbi:hypothetical protein OSB04_024448 [Centaurea solstitialis]|uniref:Uncharacterized protein n=1 Tax=Centaurea solstitialis TaxID=347529 RepID=A0AA38SZH5_9ASTR|nr:hypothetical protein OSB04_024448 [Centaurea solstitialis]
MEVSVSQFLLVLFMLLSSVVESQSGIRLKSASARALDALLQDYAYRAFVVPKTGVPFDGIAPGNLTGVKISALRLRGGSMFARGFPAYHEFRIPTGVIEHPYVERVVLVYQNLGNWSTTYYPLPGYTYLAPVLGLLAYNALDLKAKNLPELDIRASKEAISIHFGEVKRVPDGLNPRCVSLDLDGRVNFTDVMSGNRCSTFKQGHFSIVVESTAVPAPAPVPVPVPPATSESVPRDARGGGGNRSRVWAIISSAVGGSALLVLLALLVWWIRGYKRRKKMHKMERAADTGEALHMTTVGSTKAPAAMVTRTQPTLESEKSTFKVFKKYYIHLHIFFKWHNLGNQFWLKMFLPARIRKRDLLDAPAWSRLSLIKPFETIPEGTPNLGLWYPKDSGFDLTTYSDSDIAGCKLDRKSTAGGC